MGSETEIDLCERCEIRPALPNDWLCKECLENIAEQLYGRMMDESSEERAEQQAKIQTELKR